MGLLSWRFEFRISEDDELDLRVELDLIPSCLESFLDSIGGI